MPIHYTSGELFNDDQRVDAYAYGCNCEGVMNTQVAVIFRNRYPRMFEEYRQKCELDPPEFELGDVFLWRGTDNIWVFNLAVHENEFALIASRQFINKAFLAMRRQAEENDIQSIAMPPIGAGIGGLSWGKAQRVLEHAFKGWKGQLYVYVKQPSSR
jgi:O-acetyl-ADP-ribose deacetylase (regulator of RNase III)